MNKYLGIDAGSAFVSLALVDASGVLTQSDYCRHNGDPLQCLKGLLAHYPLESVRNAVRTGAAGIFLDGCGKYIDPIVAQVEGTRHFLPSIRNIFYIGAGSFSLTRLGKDGKYRATSMNSACASGSGAFLDQQAYRLSMTPETLAHRAISFSGHPPTVATRCAVFAKTDMIHLQQNGFSPEAIASGLCRSLGRSTVDSLLNGQRVEGDAVVIGGVALNTAVIQAIGDKLGVNMSRHPHPTLAGAIGAALVARARASGAKSPSPDAITVSDRAVTPALFSLRLATIDKNDNTPSPTGKLPMDRKAMKPPLDLKLSDYPQFSFMDYYVDALDTEVALVVQPGRDSEPIETTLGIDIGSTSTKATLVDRNRKVIAWAYRKTAGDPIGATKKVFRAFLDLQNKHGIKFRILAAGTTGSGRKMMHKVLRADLEMNEITAHARAAVFMDPGVDTIVELGGQDAKFTQLQNGVVYNSVMNYVCAAGTGSFIEEQAKKLGVPIAEYADFCTGVSAPNTSDRCTVFMERDLDMLLASGWSKQQVAAAVLHSVCDNYLNKVVNQLRVGDRVYFQGATARNRALVAAFEQRLGKRITVSPFCHMTGALGISLLLLDELEDKDPRPARDDSHAGRFRGLEFADTPVKCETEKCNLCANHCSLSLISTEDETVAWGLMCGREYADKRPKTRTIRAAALIERRHRLLMGEDDSSEPRAACPLDKLGASPEPAEGSASGAPPTTSRAEPTTPQTRIALARKTVIGVPKTLTMWTYLPLWRAFFRELGVEFVPSSPARDTVFKRGQQYVTAEFCAPVIVSHGHVADLLEKKVDFLFIPHMVREQTSPGFSNNHFCCYVQAHPSVIGSLNTLETEAKLLRPVIDFRFGLEHVVGKLYEELGVPLRCSRRTIRKALQVALGEQRAFRDRVLHEGIVALRSLEAHGKMGIALIGRPYNTLDPCMNLQLPGKIAERGYDIFFQDMLPAKAETITDDYSNMYWNSGQQILAASRFVAEHDRLFAIFFTSFSCGPDSYLLSYFKEEMARRKKPYLVLQFDGHGADAGYMTRVEAALESFKAWRVGRNAVSPRMSEDLEQTKRRNSVSPYKGRPTGALFPSVDDLRRRLLFIPPMEPIVARLFAAAFRGAGFKAEVLEENACTLAVGLRHTGGGECVPCPTTMGSLIHTVEKRSLQPKDVAFFMATAVGPCRFGQYNKLNEIVLRRKGWDELRILAPSAGNNYEGLDGALRKKLWDVFVVGDILRKMLLRTRPYEALPGAADLALERALASVEKEFERNESAIEPVLLEAVRLFQAVETKGPPKPKVGVVGEIYVRCNPFTNDNVIRAIEALGGEALLASLTEWILYVHFLNVQNSKFSGFDLGERLGLFLTGRFYHKRERALYKIAGEIIADREDPPLAEIIAEGAKHVPKQFQGEAILTLGRAACFVKKEGVSAIVNASPMFCMPGTTTTAIFPKLERELGVPIICNFYDGSGDPNRALIPYMHYIKAAGATRVGH